MAVQVNTRELVLQTLLEINKEGQYGHIAIRNTLEKYQYLEKQERAFITRVCEGTQENRIKIDYMINQFSKIKVEKMKPVIREILRSSVYQMFFMDSVPDNAVCDEAVKLTRKKGFYNLTGFINGVLRQMARKKKSIVFPEKSKEKEYLSIEYSVPEWMAEKFLKQFGFEKAEKILASFMEEKPLTVRIRKSQINKDEVIKSLESEGVQVEKAPYVENAYYLSGYDYLPALEAFRAGKIQVQDVSSMLVAEIAGVKEGDFVVDLCAAPGGKTLAVADKLNGTGTVLSRDVSQKKVDLIEENVARMGFHNVEASVKDATVFDSSIMDKADIVIADVPCSGLGVIGRKKDIKYNMNPEKIKSLVPLQREIMEKAACYVKPGGVMIYSTCTITKEENTGNIAWFISHYPYKLESIEPYISEELQCESTKEGYLQMLPGIHKSDGFFMARLRRME